MDYLWQYILINTCSTVFAILLYIAMRNFWPDRPSWITSLWFIITALAVIGFPVSIKWSYIENYYPTYVQWTWAGLQHSESPGYVFLIGWITLAVLSAALTFAAKGIVQYQKQSRIERKVVL
jgi:hypothetical protein